MSKVEESETSNWKKRREGRKIGDCTMFKHVQSNLPSTER